MCCLVNEARGVVIWPLAAGVVCVVLHTLCTVHMYSIYLSCLVRDIEWRGPCSHVERTQVILGRDVGNGGCD